MRSHAGSQLWPYTDMQQLIANICNKTGDSRHGSHIWVQRLLLEATRYLRCTLVQNLHLAQPQEGRST